MIRLPLRAVSVLLLLATGACDWMPGKPTREEEPVIPADVHSFNTLYRNNCSGCHGANGQLGAARPLNDPLYLALASDEYILKVTNDGVTHTLMPAFSIANGGGLTETQVHEILEGIRRAWGPMADSPSVTPPSLISTTVGSAERGRTLFTTYCSACHGPDGGGGAVAGSVVDSSFLAMTSDQALRSAIVCGRLDLGMPAWNGTINGVEHRHRAGLAPLDDQKISDLVAFLASHRVEFPGAPFPSLTDPRDTD